MAAAPASGQERSPYRLRWERGGELCREGEARLRKSVVARLGFDPFDAGLPKAGGDNERTIAVNLSAQRGGYRATLVFHDDNGNVRSTRMLETTSPDCRVVLEAAALAIALAIQTSIAQEANHPVATEPDAPVIHGDADAVVPPTLPPKPSRAAVVLSAPRPTPAPPLAARLEVAVGVAAGTLPRLAPGLAIGGLIEIHKGVWVSARMLHVPGVLADDSRFAINLSTARFGVCLDPWSTGRFNLLSCAHGAVGLISTVVSELAPVDRTPALFVGGGLGQWIYYRPTRGLAFFAGEEVTLPFSRYRLFVEGSDRTIFTVAPVTAYSFLGVALTTDPR